MTSGATVEPTNGRVPLGEALYKARTRVGFSLAAAASALRVSERELGDYESGLRTPPKAIADDLARLYGVEPERFGHREFVARVPGRFDEAKNILWLGWFRIEFDPATGSNEQLLRSIGAALRSMRSLSETAPVFIRQQEVSIIARLCDLGDADLAFLVMRYLRLSYAESSGLIERMWADVMTHDEPAITQQAHVLAVPAALAGPSVTHG